MDVAPDEVLRVANRTLRAAGYVITDLTRTDQYVAFTCERASLLRARLRFVIAVSYSSDFSAGAEARLADLARESGGVLVRVAAKPSADKDTVPWTEFLDVLGGAIPSWRALSAEFRDALLATSRGGLPPGQSGEAWRLFEDLVADGLEFVLGRRVRRMGARRRGEDLPDMLACTPDDLILVVDAKSTASADGYDGRDLRALRDYCEKQKAVQRGADVVHGAIVVAPMYRQDGGGLLQANREFYAETQLAVSYLSATTLADTVDLVRGDVELRAAVAWKRVFAGGAVSIDDVRREFDGVLGRRYQAGRP